MKAKLETQDVRKQGKSWDEYIEENAAFNDIDEKTIQKFKKYSIKRVPVISDEDDPKIILKKLNLTENNKIKHAALMLFGKNPQRFYSSAYVKIGKFLSDTRIVNTDIVEGNLFEQLENGLQILGTKYLVSEIKFEGIHRKEILEYPYEALREALINALIHRNYLGSSAVQVRVYNEQIIFMNEGMLPAEVPLEKLKKKHLSKPRNKLLADVFYKAGFIESWGRGTLEIVNTCLGQGLPEPDFDQEYGVFQVTLYNNKWNRKNIGKIVSGEGQLSPAELPLEKPGELTGSTLGKYRVLEKLSRGSKRLVFKVWDTLEDWAKVIKIVPPQIIESIVAFNGLKREIKKVSGISHPNVVKVFGLEKHEEMHFIVMEYIEGRSLEEILAAGKDGKLEETEAAGIMKKLAKVLSDTYQLHMIHRNIKPSNIMVTPDRDIKILDFGISYLLTKSMTELVGEPQKPGTWPYIAPEQLSTQFGKENEQVDVWGFGVTMYQLLTGELPFRDKEQIKDPNETPFEPEGISPKLRHVVMKCLEKDREKRFKNMKEVLETF